jgi:hypothetical protein
MRSAVSPDVSERWRSLPARSSTVGLRCTSRGAIHGQRDPELCMVNSRLMSRHLACYRDGKPLFLGEAGIIANNSAGFATRASQFDASLITPLTTASSPTSSGHSMERAPSRGRVPEIPPKLTWRTTRTRSRRPLCQHPQQRQCVRLLRRRPAHRRPAQRHRVAARLPVGFPDTFRSAAVVCHEAL